MRCQGGKEFIRKQLPLLDDWANGVPDAWDYEAVLRDNEVTVTWGDTLVDGAGRTFPASPGLCGWDFSWRNGSIFIGRTSETIARKAAAIFVSLWLRHVSASLCCKLMVVYARGLELQENKRITFLAEFDGQFCNLTRENFCRHEALWSGLAQRIVAYLGPIADDEEIIVTFTKRKK
jgi:hypothetical protein